MSDAYIPSETNGTRTGSVATPTPSHCRPSSRVNSAAPLVFTRSAPRKTLATSSSARTADATTEPLPRMRRRAETS